MSDTSYKEGLDLGIARSVWAKVASSECRIRLLTELIGLGIGFKDVEDYSHDLGLKFKSDAFKKREGGDRKLVRDTMNVKLRDETHYNREWNQEKTTWRRRIGEYTSNNKRQYLKLIKELRLESQKIKTEHVKTYGRKLEFLKIKYTKNEDEKLKKIKEEICLFPIAEW